MTTFSDELRQRKLHLAVILFTAAFAYHRVVPDMVRQWYRDDNYSHGFLVPLVAGYFLMQLWPKVRETEAEPDGTLGLAVVILSQIQLFLAWLASEYFTMRSSLVILIAGVTLLFFGRRILKSLALPIGYLVFMVPIPYIIYDSVAFPLKLFISKVSVAFLRMIGVVVLREGNIIMLPSTTLEVADACSGIRSLMSLLALAVAYAFVVHLSTARRWILICSAVPIAVATNAMRVIVTGILAQWWGARAAEGFFHEFAGLAVFALAMVLLVAEGALLRRWGR